MSNRLLVTVTVCLILIVADCSADEPPTATVEPTATEAGAAPDATPTEAPDDEGGDEVALQLTSTAYSEGDAVPVQYTCDGDNVSPPLAWSGVPEGTVSFALVFDDPDAAGWVHWALFNIPADTRSLAEGQPADAELPDGSRHGANSWGRSDYGGPCPPSGTHRYVFKLYALDSELELAAGASKAELMAAMEGHILGQTELNGTCTL